MIDKKIKIEVVFIGKPQWEAGWPHIGYNNDSLIKSIKQHLESKFNEITFSDQQLITTYDASLVNQIKEQIEKSDAVILFTIGHYGDPGIVQAGVEIIDSKKPVILANYIYQGDHTFTKIYSALKGKGYKIFPISSNKPEDFYEPIETLVKLFKMRGKRILVYAPEKIKMDWKRILGLFNPESNRIRKEHPEFLDQVLSMSSDQEFEFYTDVKGLDQAHQWRRDEEKYKENLRDFFDIEIVKGDPDEILKYYDKVDEQEAETIANKWNEEALKVEPLHKTILSSAKLYIALKNLLKTRNFDFFTPDCGTFLLTGKLPAYPCLAFMELINDGIYGGCESDLDSIISNIFGLFLTGRPGFISNHTLDTINNQITYMHCVAPNKLYGKEGSKSDYEILYHGETHFLGASPCVKFPIGEMTTTIKISVLEKKIAIRKGKIIDNIVDKRGCVSKMLVESNVKNVMDNYDWETFGWHRVTFIGDWKALFIIGAKLLGLEIIEEDESS
jgi:hypothetical protein